MESNKGMLSSQDDHDAVQIKQKRPLIILGAAVVTLLLILFAIVAISRWQDDNGGPLVTEITLCDLNPGELCIVTFGANHLNRMVINFQLPNAEYPVFYVKAKNRGIINVYSCETASAISTSRYCTGVRTPLGESIDIEVYATDGEVLMARGTLMVSAILLSMPTELIPTPAPAELISTPTSDTADQNP